MDPELIAGEQNPLSDIVDQTINKFETEENAESPTSSTINEKQTGDQNKPDVFDEALSNEKKEICSNNEETWKEKLSKSPDEQIENLDPEKSDETSDLKVRKTSWEERQKQPIKVSQWNVFGIEANCRRMVWKTISFVENPL